jgi:hypothetical protein
MLHFVEVTVAVDREFMDHHSKAMSLEEVQLQRAFFASSRMMSCP